MSEIGITGLHTFELRQQGDKTLIVHEDDHRLRRFGVLELVDIGAEGQRGPSVRGEADEIWAVVSGQVELLCVDRRVGSPSENQTASVKLDATGGQGVFIPFGVAFAIRGEGEVRMLRLATHKDGSHPGDKTFSVMEWESIYTRDNR